jgi:hypothetical protein
MTVVKIDLSKLIQDNISPDEYVFLKLISLNQFDLISVLNLRIDLEEMERNEYINTNGSMSIDFIELGPVGKNFLNIITDDTMELAGDLIKIFTNTKMGFLDPLNTVNFKLKSFKTTFPQYDSNTIKIACEMYSEFCKKDYYKFMVGSLSKFIITVDASGEVVSLLANWCETVISLENNEQSSYITQA